MDLFIIIILLFLLVGLIGAIYCIIEAQLLQITYVKLSPSHTTKNDLSIIDNISDEYSSTPSVSRPSECIRIIYFSDLHSEFCFFGEEKLENTLASLLTKYNADAVVFGGDICNKPKNIQKGIRYLSRISTYCSKNNIPFIGTTGNHDVGLTNDEINQCGFTNLNDKTVVLNGFEFRGVYDSGRHDRVWGTNPFQSHDNTTVLLSHNPDWIINAAEQNQLDNIDYMISGHIHGGQIRMPFAMENKLFRKDLLPKRDVVKGVFDGAGVKFFISRGIGCVLVPFRFLSRPEISLIDIRRK